MEKEGDYSVRLLQRIKKRLREDGDIERWSVSSRDVVEKYVPPRVLWPIQFTIGYFIFHFYLFKAISLPIVFEMIELFKWIAQIQLQLKFHAFIQFIGYKITGFVNVLKSLVVGLKNEMLRIVAKVKLSRKPMELKKPVYEDELNEEECSEA
ncbi:hypothetical protein M3Y95_00599000 [Aphelenchoides besseyi]|nr:hypothetical protein M3Y95_00599000 [Aphelenchoides besseyi]